MSFKSKLRINLEINQNIEIQVQVSAPGWTDKRQRLESPSAELNWAWIHRDISIALFIFIIATVLPFWRGTEKGKDPKVANIYVGGEDSTVVVNPISDMGKIVGYSERRTSLFFLICHATVTCVVGEHKAVELGKDLFAHVCLMAINLGRLSQSKQGGNSQHSSTDGLLLQILLSELLQQSKNDAIYGLQPSFYVRMTGR